MYVISDAHIHGVTAITTTSDCARIISGGSEVILGDSIHLFISINLSKRAKYVFGKLENRPR
jgi:hypothetical protein